MTITIDRAGRAVIPKQIRDRFNLCEGTELEIETNADEILLRIKHSSSPLIKKSGILVHHSIDEKSIDIAEFINAERNSHSLNSAENSK